MKNIKVIKYLSLICVIICAANLKAQTIDQNSLSHHSSQKMNWFTALVDQKDVPEAILSLDPRTQKSSNNKKYEIMIGVVDDNKWISDVTSDDRGYTYGHIIKASYLTNKGIRLILQYTGDLYTKDDGKEWTNEEGLLLIRQKSVEESTIKFMVDSAEQGRLLYYRAGIGWQKLSSSGEGPGATIQKKFHYMFKTVKDVRQPINVDESINKQSIVAESHVGLQKTIQLNSKLALEQSAEAGLVLSEIKDASYVTADAKVSAVINNNPESNISTKLTAGLEVRKNDAGQEVSPYVGAEVTLKKTVTCGVKVKKINGKLINYQEYNLKNQRTHDNDNIWSADCRYKF